MNPEKSQLKILIANNLGADLEDRMEGERKAMNELAGGAQALRQAGKKVVADLLAKLDADQTGDTAIPDGLEAHLVIQKIKQWLGRAGDYITHLADVEQQKAVAQGGRAAGLEDALKLLKKVQDEEAIKLQRMAEIAQAPEDALISMPRTEGELVRAANGTASERRAALEISAKPKKARKKKV
jgi:hypothetical protein